MEFANFTSIYFLTSLILIILFYIIKGRQNSVYISAVFLWEDIQQQKKKKRPRFKFRPRPLMFLQMLIVALIVLGLMQPYFTGTRAAEENVVIIIDKSASMQAEDAAPDRFSRAKMMASSYIEDMDSNISAALIGAGSQPTVLSELTSDHGLVQEKLADLTVSDTELNYQKTAELAHSYLDEGRGRIVFFTDGNFPESEIEETNILNNIEFRLIGEPIGNIAITEIKLAPTSAGANEFQLFVEFSNYYDTLQEIPYVIRSPEMVFVDDTFTIQGGEKEQKVYNLNLEERTPLIVELMIDDTLKLDNRAYAVGGRSRDIFVLIAGEQSNYLERALLLQPGVRLFYREEPDDDLNYDDYDLVIFNEYDPQNDIEGKVVYIDTLPPEIDLDDISAGDEFPVEAFFWEQHHPLLRDINPDDLRIYENPAPLIIEEKDVIIRGRQAPLLAVSEEKIILNFALTESNFPLLPSFPVFFYNVLDMFFQERIYPEYSQIRSGETFNFGRTVPGNVVDIMGPTGEIYSIEEQTEVFTRTDKTGIYQAVINDNSHDYFAVNLLSQQESDLRNTGLNLEEDQINDLEDSTDTAESRINLWPLTVILALIVLPAEWLLYARNGNGV